MASKAKPVKYVRKITDGYIYPYSEALSKRRDMALHDGEVPEEQLRNSDSREKKAADERMKNDSLTSQLMNMVIQSKQALPVNKVV